MRGEGQLMERQAGAACAGEPADSRTARYMALFRALETARGPNALFQDPLAASFLDGGLRAAALLGTIPGVRSVVCRVVDLRSPGARASGIARTRLIDEWVAQAVGDGAEQVVLLGAGFDTRPYRLAALAHARVFELDQPAVLDAKRRVLGASPARVRFAPIDFARKELGAALRDAGFDRELRTCFVWEGVSNYLDEPTVEGVLRFVADGSAIGSRLIFTYIHRGLLDGSVAFVGGANARRAVERAGEPWTFGLVPDELAGRLDSLGLRLRLDLGSAEYRRRFLPATRAHLRGYDFYRAALAEVAGS
jgi:methyltransferase (TIGR00027 family)